MQMARSITQSQRNVRWNFPSLVGASRRTEQVAYLNNVIGKDELSAWTANIASAGFTAPKILWRKENEPENFR